MSGFPASQAALNDDANSPLLKYRGASLETAQPKRDARAKRPMCVCALCSTTAFPEKHSAPTPPRSGAADRHHPARRWRKTATKDEFSATAKPAPPCSGSSGIRMKPAIGLVVRGTGYRKGCDPFGVSPAQKNLRFFRIAPGVPGRFYRFWTLVLRSVLWRMDRPLRLSCQRGEASP